MDRTRLKNYIRLLIRLCISAAALWYVFTRINFIDVILTFKSVNIVLLLLSVILFIFSKVISAFRLNQFFRSIGLDLSHRHNLKLYLLGMFYNLFLPGGIGGDGYKIFYLGKESGIKKGKIFWAVLADRISGVIALLILVIIFSCFMEMDLSFPYQYFAWILIPMIFLICYLITRKYFPYFTAIFWNTLLNSLAVQGIQVICALLILYSVSTPDIIINYLFIFLISSLVAMLPISIGGMGLRELTFLYGASWLNLDSELSVALSMAFYLISVFVSLSGIYYSLNPGKMK